MIVYPKGFAIMCYLLNCVLKGNNFKIAQELFHLDETDNPAIPLLSYYLVVCLEVSVVL